MDGTELVKCDRCQEALPKDKIYVTFQSEFLCEACKPADSTGAFINLWLTWDEANALRDYINGNRSNIKVLETIDEVLGKINYQMAKTIRRILRKDDQG